MTTYISKPVITWQRAGRKIIMTKTAIRKVAGVARHLPFMVCLVILWSCLCYGMVHAQTPVLHNPVLKGFYPDPSIIRVDSAGSPHFYLVNSTFGYFPGIPVFHSEDMVHWTQIGNVINRPSQMNFLGARITRGLFAPSISYHDGLFYLVCTQVDTGGNFVVTAKHPSGPWSDPVFLPEVQGIDPSLFFDTTTDNAYILYNGAPEGQPLYDGHRAIRMYEFDYKHLKVRGQSKVLINGGVDIAQKPVWIEGPHLMQKNNWYYLYAAEGGTSVNHSEVVFRSKSIAGPFIPYEDNPILTQRHLPKDRPHPITSAGHAQLVEGPDGHTYAFFLAVRPYESDYYNTGRETFVAPVIWKEGWPVIQTGKEGVANQYPLQFNKAHNLGSSIHNNNSRSTSSSGIALNGNFTLTDRFTGPLDLSYLFLRTIDTTEYKTRAVAGHGLQLQLNPNTVMQYQHPAFIGRRQQHLICSYSAQMVFNTSKANEKAGIIIFQNEQHFYYLCKSVAAQNGQPVLQLMEADSTGKKMAVLAEVDLPAIATDTIALKIQASGAEYSFSYKTNTMDNWKLVKEAVDARPLSTHAAGGFIGCLFGMYATSQGQPTENHVLYNWTTYQGEDKVE